MTSLKNFLDPQPKNVVDLFGKDIIRRFEKEKRGHGFGKHYKPFLTVRDVPSKGRVHRRPAITHGRIVHLLSDLELSAFLLFDWSSSVVDIREQMPLDPEKTLSIAKRTGIKHPAAKGVNQVMTTDLLLDVNVLGKLKTEAISIKYKDELEEPRVVEKQELERRYWEGEDVKWRVVTEEEIPKTLIQNIRWLVPHLHSFDLDDQSRKYAFEVVIRAIELTPEEKITTTMKHLDEKECKPTGTHLQYLRHLLAQGAFSWNMHKVNHRSLKTSHLSPSEHWINEDYEYVHAQ